MFFSKELLQQAEHFNEQANAGNVEVFENNTWRPFKTLDSTTLGESWDRICIIEKGVVAEIMPEMPYERAYLKYYHSRTDENYKEWKNALEDYKTNPPISCYGDIRIKNIA